MSRIATTAPRTVPLAAAAPFAAPRTAQAALLVLAAATFAAGFLATGPQAASHAVSAAGADLTRLLRAMAAIKLLIAAAATATVFWRLGAAITAPRFAAYAGAVAAMAAGPGLIWDMAHVALGALLLHGGLLATVVLVWRDPVVATRLAAMVKARRAATRAP